MGLEQSLENIIARFDDLAGKADAAEERMDDFIADARAEFPAINLLKNPRAREDDGAGGFVSPLDTFTGAAPTLVTQRVLLPDDPDVPPEIAVKAYKEDFRTVDFNVIEITLSQNGGDGYFMLMPGRPLRGRFTFGCLAAFANVDGINIVDQNLPGGALVSNLQKHVGGRWFNVEAFTGTVTGENKKLFIVAPFICAGWIEAERVFFPLSDAYHFYDL